MSHSAFNDFMQESIVSQNMANPSMFLCSKSR